jgi:hypothetical protein
MKKIAYSIFTFLIFFTAIKGTAQTIRISESPYLQKFTSVETPSYITYHGGIGNYEKLVYEANISPEFRSSFDKFPNLGFVFTGQMLIRMFDTYSHPVRTPSYMPRGTLFYHLDKPNFQKDQFVFITVGHHSNGQDGLLFQSDSVTVNLKDGSFATNYISVGFEQYSNSQNDFDPFNCFRFTSTYHIIKYPDLRSMYGRLRFSGDLRSTYELPFEIKNLLNSKKTKPKFTGLLHLEWIALNLEEVKPVDIKRLIVNYTISFQPAIINNVELFARVYYGQDYYNINFERTLKVFQFGVSFRDLYFR